MDFIEATQIEVKLRLVEESIPRVLQCIAALGDAELNHNPNAFSNSVAQLVLHLNGNTRQWLLQHICGVPFQRNRKAEFEAKDCTAANLVEILQNLSADIIANLPKIKESQLAQHYNIQGIQGSGFSVVIHVIEHFSYHTGQIAQLTKWLLDKDLGFYANLKEIDQA